MDTSESGPNLRPLNSRADPAGHGHPAALILLRLP